MGIDELIGGLPGTFAELRRRTDWRTPEAMLSYLEQVEECRTLDLGAAEEMAEAGLRWSAKLSPSWFEARKRYRAIAQSLLVWGGIQRTYKRLTVTETAYRHSLRFFREMQAKPTEMLELYGRLGILRREQRRLREALAITREGVTIAERYDEKTWYPRMLVCHGSVVHLLEPEDAIEPYSRAREVLYPEGQDRKYYLAATQGLAFVLCETQNHVRTEEITDLYRELVLHTSTETPHESLARIHTDWLAGHLARLQNRFEDALEIFQDVARRFEHLRMPLYRAISLLDIAEVYFACGQFKTSSPMYDLLTEVFTALDCAPDAQATASRVLETAQSELLTSDILRNAKRKIRTHI